MNPAFRVLLVLIAVVMAAQHAAAEEWRGIKPLSSTRADVLRVFGECADKEQPCEFKFENEDISIDFSGVVCDGKADPVRFIRRELRDSKTMKALGFDKRRFKSFDPSIPRNRGYRAYLDKESGVLFNTLRGEVFKIYYLPTNKDQQACRYSYGDPRQLVGVFFEHVFMINRVGCPSTVVEGERVHIPADYPITGQRTVPTWITTGGRIVAGQGTNKILLDTTGLAGKVVTVIIEVYDGSGTASGSCTFNVLPARKN